MIVIDRFLTASEVAACRTALDGATWVDGRQTSGADASPVKRNEQVSRDCEVRWQLGAEIVRKLGSHAEFAAAALPQKIHPPMFNRYRHGGDYGTHVDGAIMRLEGTKDVLRSDVSATLFLSPPDSYDGGELVVSTEFGEHAVKLEAGGLVVYPSGSLHHVNAVTSGERLAAIVWVQSMVRDAGSRRLLFDLDQAIQSLGPAAPARVPLSGVYHNLIRRWAEV